MMIELIYAYLTAAIIFVYFLAQVLGKRFDPFAPTWLFLVGFAQVYVIQAISYHSWAVSLRGQAVVEAANGRALWALVWFLLVYHFGPGRWVVPALPRPPRAWSTTAVAVLGPPLAIWGLYCSGVLARSGEEEVASAEAALFRSFPFLLMVTAIMLVVTGRTEGKTRPAFLMAGIAASAAYVLIWMFNGKRSHSLIAVLTTICAFYVTRQRRPSWTVLFSTAFAGALVVAVAIGWRNDREHERSFAGFFTFLADFRVSRVLESLNVSDGDEDIQSYETTEYGGFLLMMDTVPERAGYDYGANYLRVFSTFIPRLVWPSKPLFGRPQWIAAWQAGSELERDDEFAGPAIGFLGATQLNGGAVGTLVVTACIAMLLRAAYAYFQRYNDVPWVQFFWSITFYNAWFMVVGDDPLTWFYYNWGVSAFPVVLVMWLINRSGRPAHEVGTAPEPSFAMTADGYARGGLGTAARA